MVVAVMIMELVMDVTPSTTVRGDVDGHGKESCHEDQAYDGAEGVAAWMVSAH